MKLSQFFGAVTLCLSSVCSLANEADIVIEIDSRSATAVTEASPFSTVISRQEIIESGYLSLSEVLASSGVLHINGASSGYSASGTPDMRGFGERAAQNVLIMLDGRPLNNATLESPDLSTIPLHTISKIEILNASAGVLYGNGAVGGVINIISDQSAKRENVELKLSAGSFGSSELASSISRPLEGGGHLYVTATASTTDGYRDYTENSKTHGAMSYSRDLSDGSFSFGFDQSRTDGYLSGIALDTAVTENRKAFRTNSVQKKRSLRQTIWSKLEKTYGSNKTFQLDIGRRLSNQEGSYLSGSTIDQLLTTNSLTPKFLGQTLLLSIPADYVAGIDLSQSRYLTGTSNVRKQEISSLFGRTKIDLSDQLSLVTGARVAQDKNKLLNGSSVDNDVVAIELGIEKTLNEQIFSFRFDQNYRIATLDEQVTYPAPSYSATDTPIAPQNGNSLEFGWKSDSTRITAYYLINNDEIYYDGETSFTNTTVNKTERYGLNYSSDIRLSNSVTASINATQAYAKFTDDTYDGYTVPSTSEYFGSLKLEQKISDAWSLNILSRYQSGQYSINDWSNAYGRRNAYLETNLNISHIGKLFSSSLTVGNLFDDEHDSYHLVSSGTLYRTPAQPRSIRLEVSTRI